MSHLLDIPSEIRDFILELCLLARRAAPVDIASAERTRLPARYNSSKNFKAWGYGQNNVRYENTSYTSNATALLLVNRQLCTETQDAIARLRATGRYAYALDIMLVKESEVWATWLCVPSVTNLTSTTVDCIDVSMRTFGTGEGSEMKTRSYVHSAFTPGDGSPPPIVWCFYFLIEHFLRVGPFPKVQDAEDRRLGIRKLVLDFHTPKEGPFPPAGVRMHQWVRERRYRNEGPLRNTVLPADWLADFLHNDLYGLLCMNYHTAAYGGILHERIGEIELLVDGARCKSSLKNTSSQIDVAAFLKRLAYTDPRETFGFIYPHEKRLQRFWQWKKEAVESRQRLGLPVYEDTPVDP
ncbi:hypothetical protein EXIGLDRAFT_733449 [Exidia glandulosa HHB12029]|uniref:Uncharacterized protein n=1 Tax=Exidia glandulosa HHB12029 TaxID=1314781 RepID=A0A165BAK7_EXIGL|nr:hypothetical protein EXIGLDRAFT_733449 [Exidia glandulosa HHB12029]